MGQEIDSPHFKEDDFIAFQQRLERETEQLRQWFAEGHLSAGALMVGFELEAWLLDSQFAPAAINSRFIEQLNSPLVTPELAQFNIELNSVPLPIEREMLSQMERQLQQLWNQCQQQAEQLDAHLLMCGILPTLQQSDLNHNNMSTMKRYQALNEQVFSARQGRPLKIDIQGLQQLHTEHHDVMLESATTSFQIHLQVPTSQAVHYYNSSLLISAVMVAASANSPLLFGKQLWEETRIPLFEQSVEVGGYAAVAHGPLHRVSFGSGYAHHSLLECFVENLHHFPPLLPRTLDEPESSLPHLRLHNGTIWRWNRPLIGFDADGKPHLRIEHRAIAGGPSVTDSIANAAFYYGLVHYFSQRSEAPEQQLDFAMARDNFYRAARSGLDCQITWLDGRHHNLRRLILDELIHYARQGLLELNIHQRDMDRYLGIIERRVNSRQTGAEWQRRYLEQHGDDLQALTRAYLDHQNGGLPVDQWSL